MAAAAQRLSRSRLPNHIISTRHGSARLRVAAVVAALLPIGAAGPQLPGLGRNESRVGIDSAAMPWAAVVRLQIPGVSRCTGFMLAPRIAITAAHCLYGRRLGRFAPPGSVHVLSGYVDGAFTHHSIASSFRVAEGYDPLATRGTQGADVAVVILAAAMSAAATGLPLDHDPVASGTPLMLGGYGQDRAVRIAADVACTAHDTAKKTVIRKPSSM